MRGQLKVTRESLTPVWPICAAGRLFVWSVAEGHLSQGASETFASY